MTSFQPRDPAYASKVRASFAQQTIMGLVGAKLVRVDPGEVEIELPYRPDLCQQHGFFHAGVQAMIADSAAGYAAFSLFPPDSAVLSTHFSIHLLAPAAGDRLRAVARVVKPGRTLTVVDCDVYVRNDGDERHCARMTATMMCLQGRADLVEPR